MKKFLYCLVVLLFGAHLCAPVSLAQTDIANISAVAVEVPVKQTLAARYLDAAIKYCDVSVRTDMELYTSIGELVAERYVKGGEIDLPINNQPLMPELIGRSGGIMHIGGGRGWKKAADRTDEEKAHDMAILGWSQKPHHNDLELLQKLKARGVFIIGIGPGDLEGMDDLIPLCDAFIPAGTGRDHVLTDDAGQRVGRFNDFAVTIAGWTLTAEIVGALTRQGKMPTMWKSWAYPDGREWSDKYFLKQQFHSEDEFTIRPYEEGEIANLFLDKAVALLQHVRETEVPDIRKAADLIVAEHKAGRKTIAAWAGHMPQLYLGRYEDKRWANITEVHASVPQQVAGFAKNSAEGALVLRVGYQGLSEKITAIIREKQQRLILMAGRHTSPEFAIPEETLVHIDMGYELGDAIVPIEGYPILLFPPSGFMQAAVYNAIDAEVQPRLSKTE